NPNVFPDGTLFHAFANSGSATGIGDVTVRLKGGVARFAGLHLAAAVDFRFASGNALNYLGAGALGIKPFIILSGGGRVSPHANLGYQWNGQSILAGNVTGTDVFFQTTFGTLGNGLPSTQLLVQNGPATKAKLPDNYYYSLGIDVGATRN